MFLRQLCDSGITIIPFNVSHIEVDNSNKSWHQIPQDFIVEYLEGGPGLAPVTIIMLGGHLSLDNAYPYPLEEGPSWRLFGWLQGHPSVQRKAWVIAKYFGDFPSKK